MRTIKHSLLLVLLAVLFLSGCKKEDIPPEKEMASALTQKINSFIEGVMTDVYLWYNMMPDIDIKYETNSMDYFYKLLYEEDKWSYITDDITAFENSLQGIEKTYGYSLILGKFVDGTGTPTGNYFAVVEYVYPDSPASAAGFARGDIIIKIDNANITKDNYINLFYGNSVTLTKGILTQGGITTGAVVTLTAEELTLDPVLMYKVIERSGHKIGYLMYLQYIASYDNTSLQTALQSFKDNQITDLVIDLRYNPGGMTTAVQYLCSSIAPLSVVNNNSILAKYQWNDKYQAYWSVNGYLEQLGFNFDPEVPVKLGMNKVYFLTGNGTASASELTICGLEPYMDVVLIGDSTYGKYTASITIKPEDWYNNATEYADFKNWGLQPIILRYANAQGLTNFKDGFGPDFLVEDELMPAQPLGELTEPLLKKAVEDITGETLKGAAKGERQIEFEVIDRISSRFDEQKRNLFLDNQLPKERLPLK